MLNSPQATVQESVRIWRMPIAPEDYDRSPLTDEERRALEVYATARPLRSGRKEVIAARKTLARLSQPVADVYHLRYGGSNSARLTDVQCLLRREMHRREKMFWDWSSTEWMDVLCPSVAVFREKYRTKQVSRVTITDMAYLLGMVNDLRSVGMYNNITSSADVYFGSELVAQQLTRVFDILKGKGYSDGKSSANQIQQILSMLFILNRSPFLEDIRAELLAALIENSEGYHKREACRRIWTALEGLDLLPSYQKEEVSTPRIFDKSGMAPEWYEWCMAWYEREVDFTPRQRVSYAGRILVVGRWLHQHFPEIRTPEQWTEDLALHFRGDLCSWTNGQYASSKAKQILEAKQKLGLPIQAQAITHYLTALRRYFTDLSKRPHAVSGEPARKIRLDFTPGEALAEPAHIRLARDRAAPRDIDLRVWAKLAIAAATLSENDLPRRARYPLSYYRAVGLIWVTSARRPNEIERLRLDCVREDWDPDMLDEDNDPVERIVPAISDSQGGQQEKKVPKIFYLHIPAGKNKVMRDNSAPVNPVTSDERRCCLPCGPAKSTTGVKAKTSAPPHSAPHLRGLDIPWCVTSNPPGGDAERAAADGRHTTAGLAHGRQDGGTRGPSGDSSRKAPCPPTWWCYGISFCASRRACSSARSRTSACKEALR